MNYLFLLSALCLALVSCSSGAAFGKPNGQPGCQTQEEISTVLYPHYSIKNQYWVCQELGVPATLEYCPIATAFLDDAKACVPWSLWYYIPAKLPPSQPIVGDI